MFGKTLEFIKENGGKEILNDDTIEKLLGTGNFKFKNKWGEEAIVRMLTHKDDNWAYMRAKG